MEGAILLETGVDFPAQLSVFTSKHIKFRAQLFPSSPLSIRIYFSLDIYSETTSLRVPQRSERGGGWRKMAMEECVQYNSTLKIWRELWAPLIRAFQSSPLLLLRERQTQVTRDPHLPWDGVRDCVPPPAIQDQQGNSPNSNGSRRRLVVLFTAKSVSG